MKRLATLLVLASGVAYCADPPKNGALKVTFDKKQDSVTGPRDSNGRIDYAAALNERLRRGVTPNNNSVVLLWKALGPKPEGMQMPAKYFELLGSPQPPEQGSYYVPVNRFVKDHLKRAGENAELEMWEQIQQAARRPWTPKEFPDVAAWLKVNEAPLGVIAEAVTRDRYYNPLIPSPSSGLMGVLLPGIQSCRELASVLTARAMLQCTTSPRQAWQDLHTCYRLSRQLTGGGGLIEMLVGSAVHTIASQGTEVLIDRATLDLAQVQGIQKDLESLPPLSNMPRLVDGPERILFCDQLMMIDRELNALMAKEAPRSILPVTIPHTDWTIAISTANVYFDRASEALRQPTRKARAEQISAILEDLKKLPVQTQSDVAVAKTLIGGKRPVASICRETGNLLLSFSIPMSARVTRSADKAQQIHDNLVTALELTRYRLEKDHYPEALTSLGRGGGDIFSGKPVIYRQVKKGFILYSVGPNGIDDDGDPESDDLVIRAQAR